MFAGLVRGEGDPSLSVPKTWDDEALRTSELPLANPAFTPEHVPGIFYYSIPERPIYRSYPVYVPGREPEGYLEKLRALEPEVVWGKDARNVERRPRLETPRDWEQAGELVFDAAISYSAGATGFLTNLGNARDPDFFAHTDMPADSRGEVPFFRYVIREKGRVELGQASCGMCHTRVLPDGAVLKGAQGNFPLDRAVAYNVGALRKLSPEIQNGSLGALRRITRTFFGAPWMDPDPADAYQNLGLEDVEKLLTAIPPGVIDRQGSSAIYPVQIPDLIGIKDRRYLDHTGLQKHRGPADLMRYGALNQDMNVWARYGNWRPASPDETLPPAAKLGRYSDEQLYALAMFLYSLQAPVSPHALDSQAREGKEVFLRAGCNGCHTAPLYTNNKLTPADGFAAPSTADNSNIVPITVGTDNRLALRTRRGTGYYKVPSLKGLWYRSPLEHGGSVASLEDWFNPARLRSGDKTRGGQPVRGHQFGMSLTEAERTALVAFLRTL